MSLRIREHKEETAFPAVTGASSLLVIFSVLCLSVFALLSLSTVLANRRIRENNTAAVQGYYDAEEKANQILAKLRQGEVPEGVSVTTPAGADSAVIYEYSCPISETQQLCVTVQMEQEGAPDARGYTVLRWQAVSTLDWEADETLPVWQ